MGDGKNRINNTMETITKRYYFGGTFQDDLETAEIMQEDIVSLLTQGYKMEKIYCNKFVVLVFTK